MWMGEPDQSASGGRERARALVDVGATLLSELDLETVLPAIVDAARQLTGAQYAALGVLNPDGTELERFIYLGVDEDDRRAIGDLPRGRGVLGELIREPAPLRLRDVEEHPRAYGFPPGHPPMHSFLGVPITVRGETFGNLYMTEKRGATDFDDADEEAARTLAIWAGIAIDNARLYTSLSKREVEVERALRRAETAVDIARAIGSEVDVDRVLDLIAKRGRALVDSRALLVLLRRDEQLVVAARAGAIGREAAGLTIPVEDSFFGTALRERVTRRHDRGSPPSQARLRERLGAETAMVVPLLFRGYAVGALVALDREDGDGEFGQEDQRQLEAFAASAATAVATAQTVESGLLRQQVEVAESERGRWAQELHDDTLQVLAAIRISLAAALRSDAEDRSQQIERAAAETVERLEAQINELSRLINDLRPAALERLGLAGALEALAEESAARGGIEIEVSAEVGKLQGEEERVVYRLSQEALNNVVKHAGASRARLEVSMAGREVRVVVEDDGTGFERDPAASGHGLPGMRERVEQIGGELEVSSEPGRGTRVAALFPVRGA